MPLSDYVYGENRYQMLRRSKPEVSERLIESAQKGVNAKFKMLKLLASREV